MMKCLSRDGVSWHSQIADAQRRWVYLPHVTTSAALRSVLDGLLPLLESGRNREHCWYVDLSGICVPSEAEVVEIERFLRTAKEEKLRFELRGIEGLSPAAQGRIREILAETF